MNRHVLKWRPELKQNSRALPDPSIEPTISVERAARILGCGRATAYAMANGGTLPVLRCGRRVVVSSAGLLRMLDGAA